MMNHWNAYFAGIIDGEGCITFQVHQGKSRIHTAKDGSVSTYANSYSPILTVRMANEKIINLLQEYFGGKIYFQKGKAENHHDIYVWRVNKREEIVQVLTKINRYLIVKYVQGESMLKYCKSRIKRAPKR